MPSLDFTDVLLSPEFLDTITIESETRTIGDGGVAQDTTPTSLTASAIVVPGKSNLRRADDGSRVSAFVEVYTRAALSPGGVYSATQERLPDEILWHGQRYVVAAVEDYSAFASGFIKASCDLVQQNFSAS